MCENKQCIQEITVQLIKFHREVYVQCVCFIAVNIQIISLCHVQCVYHNYPKKNDYFYSCVRAKIIIGVTLASEHKLKQRCLYYRTSK